MDGNFFFAPFACFVVPPSSSFGALIHLRDPRELQGMIASGSFRSISSQWKNRTKFSLEGRVEIREFYSP